ncbi:unnamed protein product [Cuscuta campestris]|uniref:Endonuclease/exonuclease/phosphatase domain-containing protein n=1 Tax=Cuscuta campestris TaxID=132261 RepID=A0A484KX78_9ASTE|nr:unnamed protein product [Cuscuta campestris]
MATSGVAKSVGNLKSCKNNRMHPDAVQGWGGSTVILVGAGTARGYYKDAPSVEFTSEEENVLAGKFNRTLVGRCSSRIHLSEVEKFLIKGGYKEFKLRRLNSFELIFIFKQDEDYLRLFHRKVWRIGACAITINKWTTKHSKLRDSPVMPVWVEIFNLPLHLNDHKALYSIASTLGRPLKLDANTAMGVHPDRARLCVEMDVSNPKPPRLHIKLGGRDLWLPCKFGKHLSYCDKCTRFRHDTKHCRKTLSKSLSGKAPAGEVGQLGAGCITNASSSRWEIAKGKRRVVQSSEIREATRRVHSSNLLLKERATHLSHTLQNKTPLQPTRYEKPLENPTTHNHFHLLPIIEDVEDTVEPNPSLTQPYLPTLTAQCPPHLTPSNPSPTPTTEPFPDLSFLRSDNPKPCLAIIPFHHSNPSSNALLLEELDCHPQVWKGSKDDSFINTTLVPSWENFNDQHSLPEDDTPMVCHTDGEEEDTPFNKSCIKPMELDISNCATLIFIKRKFDLDFLCVIEPIVSNSLLDDFRLKIGFSNCHSSTNNKRWIFWRNETLNLVSFTDDDQVTSGTFTYSFDNQPIRISSVYGAHSIKDRTKLWLNIQETCPLDMRWIIGGDFNAVTSYEECKGICTPHVQSMNDFNTCISQCKLIYPDAEGGLFTWSGVRSQGRTWRRLDRILLNVDLLNSFEDVTLKHLSRANSDHKALLLQCINQQSGGVKPFRFLNSWISHETFQQTIRDVWSKCPTTGGMRGLTSKLQATKTALKLWNQTTFGNIFLNLKNLEQEAIQAQQLFETDTTDFNRTSAQLANAKLIKAVNMEVDYWRQKANYRWLDKGDANSKLFQAYAKGKRKKLSIKHIITSGGRGISSPNEIKEEAIQHFQKLYTSNHTPSHSIITSLIPKVITKEDNMMLSAIPNINEVKKVVWERNGDSASGPDGFNGNFFKTCWETIKNDVLIASQEFFLGRPIPCAYGSTYLTLIPKTLNPKRFDDYRPISLSTFMSKINTRILSNRLNTLLHKLISPEQAAFQKGRSIDDHILVAQEAIHIIDKKGQKNGRPKYHWKNWNQICHPKQAGGLGIRNLEKIQQAYSLKLWWKAQNDQSIWGPFVRAKYMRSGSIKEKITDSPSWKRICRVHAIGAKVWEYFGHISSAPPRRIGNQLRQHLIAWWLSGNSRSFKGNLRLILPGIISWVLWKARNTSIHEGKSATTASLIQQCFKLVQGWCWVNRNKKWLVKDEDFKDFDPSVESPLVPVWVGLEGLPIHLFDKPTLFSIAKLFGSPLQTDAATVNLSRPNVARVCVEVKLTKELPKTIWIHLRSRNSRWVRKTKPRGKVVNETPGQPVYFPSTSAVPTSTTPITFGSLETGHEYVTTKDIGPCPTMSKNAPPPRLDTIALAPPTNAHFVTLNGPLLTGLDSITLSLPTDVNLDPSYLECAQHKDTKDIPLLTDTTVPPIGNDDALSVPSTHTKAHTGKDDEAGKDAPTEAEPVSPHTLEDNTNISCEPRSLCKYIKVTKQQSSPLIQEFQKLSFTEQIAELKQGHQQLNSMQPKAPFQSIQGTCPKPVDANLFEVLQDHDENESHEESDPETPTMELRHKGEPPDMTIQTRSGRAPYAGCGHNTRGRGRGRHDRRGNHNPS